jgi:hypothetical protein
MYNLEKLITMGNKYRILAIALFAIASLLVINWVFGILAFIVPILIKCLLILALFFGAVYFYVKSVFGKKERNEEN